MSSQIVRPDNIAPPPARYAHAVATTGAQKWLHTSGVVPTRVDGSVPDDVGEQAATVWQNISAMLTEAQLLTHRHCVGHYLCDCWTGSGRSDGRA